MKIIGIFPAGMIWCLFYDLYGDGICGERRHGVHLLAIMTHTWGPLL